MYMYYSILILGDGKTFYIKKELKKFDKYSGQKKHSVTIAINEAFCVESAIKKLRELPQEKSCAIYFNFTLIPPGVSAVI